MYRGRAAWTGLASLAAALLALQLFAPTVSFATAHTSSQAKAKAQPGTQPSGTTSHPGPNSPGKAPRDETATCRSGHHGDPTGPLRTRHRSHTADSAPAAPERPLRRDIQPSVPEPAGPGAAHHHASRCPVSHLPAALRVFRC
ncbi:hypothetical protein GCM10017668_55430 [Streptomyces tuirus]|uniref:Secreted protein n=1 Tax=Streptomyces tuirus TaxID=68278 RepID=A0A7G1NPU4_9ACTN|nr:hypothetical protein [Streptomyces tuirus]BCL23700.1 hypothetical protein GCM10017668_55430 [Streptomyces tuirus]